jgi:hypothetical protein
LEPEEGSWEEEVNEKNRAKESKSSKEAVDPSTIPNGAKAPAEGPRV